MPNVHPAIPPRVGQLKWFEVITQTPFPGPGNRYQTKVTKFGARVYWSSLAFDHHGHVQLLQKQLDYFTGWRRRTDVQLQAGGVWQTRVVRSANLCDNNRGYLKTIRYLCIGTMVLNCLRKPLTSMIPGAGTGTSDSLFIVASENPSSSTLFTSLALRENKLNLLCQHDIVKVESIDITTRYTLNYYCIIDKLTRRDWTLTIYRLDMKTVRRYTLVRLYCL